MEEIIKELDKILPVVVRVHGENHPELAQVGTLYADMRKKLDEDNKEEAKKLLMELKSITSDFSIPNDACPTYERTYKDLSQILVLF